MEREVLIKGLVLRAFLDKLLKAGVRRLPTKRIWVERKGPGGQIVGFWQTVHYQPEQASQGSLFGDSPKEEAKPSGRGKKSAPVQQGSLFDAPQEPSEANPAQPALFDGDPAETGNVRAKHESILEAVRRRAESADSGGKEAGGQIHAEEGKGPSATPSGPGEGPVAEAPSPSGDSGKEAPEPADPSKEEADAEEIRQKAYKENRIAGIADLRAGDRVWSENHKKYGKVIRLGAHTAYLAFPKTPLGRAVPVEMGIRNHGLWWRSPDDAEAAVRMGMSIRPLREKPAGPVKEALDRERQARVAKEQDRSQEGRHLAEKPSEEEGYQEGDRVVLKDGRHGTVSKVSRTRWEAWGGLGQGKTSTSYYVKTDNGATRFHGHDDLEPEKEGETPENVTPDIWHNDSWHEPHEVLSSALWSAKKAQEHAEAAGRARLSKNKAEHLNQSRSYERVLERHLAAWHEWAATHPEAAEQVLSKHPEYRKFLADRDKDREAVEQARQVAQAPSKREAGQQYAGAGEKVASGNGITVSHNKALGGVEIRFPGPISPDMSARLKAKGFKYSSRQKLWYARHSDERLRFAQGLAEG